MAESVAALDLQYLYEHFDWHNKCSDSPIWDGWYPRLRIAIFAIFLLYYVFVIPALFFLANYRSKTAWRVLSWYSFIPAVISMAIYMLLCIIGDAYFNCLRIRHLTYFKVFAAVDVFRNLANVLVLGVIFFQLIPRMLSRAKPGEAKYLQIGMMALYPLVVAFFIIYIIFWDFNMIHLWTAQKIINDKNGVAATYVTLYLVAALLATAALVRSCLEIKRKQLNSEGLFPYSGLLGFALVSFATIDMIVVFGWRVHSRTWTKEDSAGLGIVSLFTQACVYGLLVALAMSKALDQDDRRLSENNEEKALHNGNGTQDEPQAQNIPVAQNA